MLDSFFSLCVCVEREQCAHVVHHVCVRKMEGGEKKSSADESAIETMSAAPLLCRMQSFRSLSAGWGTYREPAGALRWSKGGVLCFTDGVAIDVLAGLLFGQDYRIIT